ncbi:MAG: hypothetical protein H7145_01035 [Akkermansiaceae bacterium]|nr:hypothetical protein [Armatimonadota bacterium]
MQPKPSSLSPDWSLRHRILGMPDPLPMDAPNAVTYGEDGRLHWFGGAESFTGLSVGAMQTLIELGFLDPTAIRTGRRQPPSSSSL